MLSSLLAFEWHFARKRRSFYPMLAIFLVLGILIGLGARFPFPNTWINGTYVTHYVLGMFSLVAIFSTTLLAAQTLFREEESHFDEVLYATPLRRMPYLISRFLIIALVTALCYLLLTGGLAIGHGLRKDGEFGPANWRAYVHPFLLLLLPNILFCTAVACSVALFTRNRLLVYVSGVVIYFLYWGIAMFTNSPLIANSSPVSAASMHWSALLDPFGLAAFLEQTRYWSAAQRNTQLPVLQGDLLINRLVYLGVAAGLLAMAYRKFSFSIIRKNARTRRSGEADHAAPPLSNAPVSLQTNTWTYHWRTFWSFTRTEGQLLRSGPALPIICLAWLGFYLVETFSDIGGSTRLPKALAITGRMIEGMAEGLPLAGVFIVLLFAEESVWRSERQNFSALEQVTPASRGAWLLSRWAVLCAVIATLLLTASLGGIAVQVLRADAPIDGNLYLKMMGVIAGPLMVDAAIAVALIRLIHVKYLGAAITGVVLLLLNSSLGSVIGLRHPLWHLPFAMKLPYSEMNGLGNEPTALAWKLALWAGVALGMMLLAAARREGASRRSIVFQPPLIASLVPFTFALLLILYLVPKTQLRDSRTENDWSQAYEQRYGYLKQRLQPTITGVNTTIDLFPSEERYRAGGRYLLENKSDSPVDSLFVTLNRDVQWRGLRVEDADLVTNDTLFGVRTFRLRKPLQPGGRLKLHFRFDYRNSPFQPAGGMNTIIRNGSFVRISRYFPVVGYLGDNEIDDHRERLKRGMPKSTRLLPLDAPVSPSAFVRFKVLVSTDKGQTPIAIGTLVRSWTNGGRSYAQYETPEPVPFRLAVASARYATTRDSVDGIAIEVYTDPAHGANVPQIIASAKQTLRYCSAQFGKYPFPVARFVEIASTTSGFAGTAYPGSLFIREAFGFRQQPADTPGRDILTEMVAHETAHAWWGNSGIDPDYREGSKLMTETMAMYVELMVFKHRYGETSLPGRVALHRDLYLSERSSALEEPLYKGDPAKPYLFYDKGCVVMYDLYRLMGEQRLNRALRRFYQGYRYPHVPPKSTDILNELFRVAKGHEKEKIRRWLMEVE